MSINILLPLHSIGMYYSIEMICEDTKACFRGRAPNRHRLFLSMVHAHRYMKGDNPLDKSPIYQTRTQWIDKIIEVDRMFPTLKLFYALSRSGGFGSFNELAEHGLLIKIENPADRRGYLYSINMDHLKCAGCVMYNIS